MATYFEPIIGSGFGDIAAQRQFWGSRNLATQEANLARAAAAQQNFNDYFARVAAIRDNAVQRNVGLQVQQDLEDRRYGWLERQSAAAQAEADRQRRWLDTQNKLALGERREEIAAQERIAADKLKFQREMAASDVDANGQMIASQYPQVKRGYDEANTTVNTLETELATLEERQKALETKAGTRGPLGLWGGVTEEEKAEQATNLQRQGEIKKLLNPKGELMRARDRAERTLEKFQDQLTGTGYTIDDDSGLVRHNTGKSWNFRQAMQAAAARGADVTGPLFAAPNLTVNALQTVNSLQQSPFTARPTATTTTPQPAAVPTTPGLVSRKQLTLADAQTLLIEAGGDRVRARQLAKERGYAW